MKRAAPVLLPLLLLAAYFVHSAQAAPPPPPPVTCYAKAVIFDLAASSNADVLTSSITGSLGSTSVDGETTGRSAGEKTSKWRLTIGLTSTNSVVNVECTYNSKSYNLDLNSGTALTAGNLYAFEFGAHGAVSINVQCETSTRIAVLILEEVIGD